MKVTNKMVEGYLTDCLGYDELMIDELKDTYNPLKGCLSDDEIEACLDYNE